MVGFFAQLRWPIGLAHFRMAKCDWSLVTKGKKLIRGKKLIS
jgi:hypothetical protein